MKPIYVVVWALFLILISSVGAADKPDDGDALRGVTEGKVVFDINMADPKKMTLAARHGERSEGA